jgi:hypothetical protein
MIRLSTLFWLATVAITGFTMFAVKYEVQSLADQLARTSKQADDAEWDLRALAAEWAFLNRPDTLAELNQRLLSLVPIQTKQLRTSLADIPMRPVAPPAPPEPAVADAAGAAMATPPAQAAIPLLPAPAVTAAAEPPAVSPVAAALGPTPGAAAAQPATPGTGQSDQTVVALDTVAAARPAAAPAPAKRAAQSSRPHRAASLDELIAQITESR